MNITIYTSYYEAATDADRAADRTGIDHHVIERFPAGPIAGALYGGLLPYSICEAEHRYTVLSQAEWADVADYWDAEVHYTAPGQETA